jgi:transcriptional regulator with XRE-family HTH domain
MNNLNLKAYCAQIGLTLTQFAELIDCSAAYLSGVSTGNRIPGPRLANEIMRATNYSVKIESTKDKKKKEKQNEKTISDAVSMC